MSLVFWSNEFSVGNKEIDRQHEHILSLVNALEVAGTSGEGAATADLVLGHLLQFLARHFGAEERLMEVVGYTGLPLHQQQHAECSRTLAAMVSSVEAGEMNAVDCVPFIRDWLHSHLLGSDQQYASWVARRPDAVMLWTRELEGQRYGSAALCESAAAAPDGNK